MSDKSDMRCASNRMIGVILLLMAAYPLLWLLDRMRPETK